MVLWDKLAAWNEQIYTTVYKIDNPNKDLLYAIENCI